jgi:predicted CXXCH cytochrome family protein
VGAEEQSTPPERLLYRDVKGRVVDTETGKPVSGVTVSLLYEVMVTDESGRFVFEKVPLRHTAEVSLRIQARSGPVIGCITLDVPVSFYPLAAEAGAGGAKKVAVEIIDPASDEGVELRLEPVGSGEVGEYCTRCHQSNPCLELSTFEEVIKSGKDLRGIIVFEDELEAFKKNLAQRGLRKTTYQAMRYQDTHPDDMNMATIVKLDLPQYRGQYAFPSELELLDGKFVTCDTCHTRHTPTAQKHYVKMPYEENNELCYACHK